MKLIEVDTKTGKLRLSRKALLPKPEGYVEPVRKPRPQGQGDRRNSNDRKPSGDRRNNNDRKPRGDRPQHAHKSEKPAEE